MLLNFLTHSWLSVAGHGVAGESIITWYKQVWSITTIFCFLLTESGALTVPVAISTNTLKVSITAAQPRFAKQRMQESGPEYVLSKDTGIAIFCLPCSTINLTSTEVAEWLLWSFKGGTEDDQTSPWSFEHQTCRGCRLLTGRSNEAHIQFLLV